MPHQHKRAESLLLTPGIQTLKEKVLSLLTGFSIEGRPTCSVKGFHIRLVVKIRNDGGRMKKVVGTSC